MLFYLHCPVFILHSRSLFSIPRGSQLQSSHPISGSYPKVRGRHSLQLSPVTLGGHMHCPEFESHNPLGHTQAESVELKLIKGH